MKAEIAKLRDKAAEVAEYFSQQGDFYVRSGSEIFNLNRNNYEDLSVEQAVAERYLQKFQWYLNDSPLIEECEIDMTKEAADFKERFAAFFEARK